MRFMLVTLLLAVSNLGCGHPFFCPHAGGFAIRVTVRDAESGANLADKVRGSVTQGSYVDSLSICGLDDALVPVTRCGGNRAGIYNVALQCSGYRPWVAVNVVVRESGCLLRTAQLTADLIPEQDVVPPRGLTCDRSRLPNRTLHPPGTAPPPAAVRSPRRGARG